MIQEILVLTSSSLRSIVINEFIDWLKKFSWKNLSLELRRMPRKDVNEPQIIQLSQLTEFTVKNFDLEKSPIESVVLDAESDQFSMTFTAILDKNIIKWIEVLFKANSRSTIDQIFTEFNNFLKKTKP